MNGRSVPVGQRGEGRLKAIIWLAILVVHDLRGHHGRSRPGQRIRVSGRHANTWRASPRPTASQPRHPRGSGERSEEGRHSPPARRHPRAEPGGNVRISAPYSVTVDLHVYQWTLNFIPARATTRCSFRAAIGMHFHSQPSARRLYFEIVAFLFAPRSSAASSHPDRAEGGRFGAPTSSAADRSIGLLVRPAHCVGRASSSEGHRVRVRINRGFLLRG